MQGKALLREISFLGKQRGWDSGVRGRFRTIHVLFSQPDPNRRQGMFLTTLLTPKRPHVNIAYSTPLPRVTSPSSPSITAEQNIDDDELRFRVRMEDFARPHGQDVKGRRLQRWPKQGTVEYTPIHNIRSLPKRTPSLPRCLSRNGLSVPSLRTGLRLSREPIRISTYSGANHQETSTFLDEAERNNYGVSPNRKVVNPIIPSTVAIELARAAHESIRAGGGFGWIKCPPFSTLVNYFHHVGGSAIAMHNAMQHATVEEPVQEDQSPLLPPSRSVLLVAFDFDGEEEERRLRKHQSALFFDDEAPPLAGGRPEVISTPSAIGSLQLTLPDSRLEILSHACTLECFFVAPKGRKRGVGAALLRRAELECRRMGLSQINLVTRETQQGAIRLYERHGFKQWGKKDNYARLSNGEVVAGLHFTKDLKDLVTCRLSS